MPSEGRTKDMRQAKFGLVLVGTLVAVLVLAGCGATSTSTATTGNDHTGSSGGGTPQVTCASTGAAICTKSISVGGSTQTVLATSNGKTLYYFMSDTSDQIACSGSCASLWPPLMSPSATMSDNFGLSGMVSVDNGANGTQLAYNGHPLYSYSHDQAITDANGEGFEGKWFVVTPDVQPLSPTNSGGGYGGYGNYP
jgi:predicted lipoprotein with Yx(FWY)xxD motif